MASGIEKQCQVIPHPIRHRLFKCAYPSGSVSMCLSLSPHPRFFLWQIGFFFSVWELQVYIFLYQPLQKKESSAFSSSVYKISREDSELPGLDMCSFKTGPYDCLLDGHFLFLPHKHSYPITVPDDYVLWKVDSSIAPRAMSFLTYINHGTLIPLPVTSLGMGIGHNPL